MRSFTVRTLYQLLLFQRNKGDKTMGWA